MSRTARSPMPRRCATALVHSVITLTLAAPAQASRPTAALTTGVMTLQDPATDADVAPTPVPPPAAPVAEDPTPPAAPVAEGPPPPAAGPVGPDPRKGLGLLITGAVMTGAVGLPITLWGIYLSILARKDAADPGFVPGDGTIRFIPVIVTGILVFAAGAPMLGVGAYRFSRWHKWKRGEQALTPTMNRSAHGTWTAGLALRF